MTPPPEFQAAAEIVAASFPRLTESGVPAVIAFRAMAAAIQAIFRSQDRSGFAKSWSRDQLALGFLVGALKCEWVWRSGREL